MKMIVISKYIYLLWSPVRVPESAGGSIPEFPTANNLPGAVAVWSPGVDPATKTTSSKSSLSWQMAPSRLTVYLQVLAPLGNTVG